MTIFYVIDVIYKYIFFNGKDIINQVSIQDEQRPMKKKLYNRDVVYMRNIKNKHQTQTPPKRGPPPNPIVKKTPINFQIIREDTNPTQPNPESCPWTLTPDLEAKVIGPSESKK
jgi:hypothetical protein